MTEGFITKREGAFLHVTIDRADDGNRVTDPMLDGLAALVDDASSDPDLKGIVLREREPIFVMAVCKVRRRPKASRTTRSKSTSA